MTASALLPLKHQVTLRLPVSEPFNFRYTFWKPSHFATGLEIHSQNISWRTFRLGPRLCGARFVSEDGHVKATIFSDKKLTSSQVDQVSARISHSYGLSEDLNEFIALAARLDIMREPLCLLAGMRQSCPENLFEISVISLLLQNATIQRTKQMMANLLRNHGRMVLFDGVELRVFFTPSEIADVDEKFHRDANRLGYRAKYIPRFAEFFADKTDVLAGDPAFMAAYQQIKGVGPYTAAIVASHASREPSALGLDVWNRKILARWLLGVDDAQPEVVREACSRSFPGYEGIAALYLLEYEYASAPMSPLVDHAQSLISSASHEP